MIKKTIAVALTMTLAIGSLVGCGSSSDVEKAGNNGKKELRIMMSSGDFGADTIKPALEKAADIMGVSLEYDVIPDDQMLNVLNTQLSTGNANDVVLHNFGVTDVSAKDLEPLEGEWTDKITSTTKPLCTDENGKILKAPLGGESNMGLLYNKKILEECGVKMPLKNYEEFMNACEKIKDAGYTPVYISNKETWTAQILVLGSMTTVFVDNPELIEKITTNQVKPADIPKLKKIWENAVSIKDEGYVNEDYMSATNDMGLEALANGECAFYAQMDNTYGTLKAGYPDQIDDIGMSYVPLWDDEKDGYVLFDSATNYLSVPAGGDNVELAKEFVNTVLSEEPLKVYYDTNPGAAPFENLEFELSVNPFNEEMLKYAETMPRYGTFNNNAYDGKISLEPFYGAFSEQIQGMFSGKSVDETLESWYNAYAADAQARQIEGF